MNDFDALEQRLRQALKAVAATTPDDRPTADRRPMAVATVAAVAIAGVGLGAIVVVTGRDGPGNAVGSTPTIADASVPSASPAVVPTTSIPSSPSVLMPADEFDAQISVATAQPTNPDHWSAALFAPTGEVFGVFVQPRLCPTSMGPTCGDVADSIPTAAIAGNTVVAVPSAGDEAIPGSTLYMVHGQCASVTISAPPSLAAWDDVALSVLSSITVAGGDVTIVLPVSAGWSSPGTGRGATRYLIQFEAVVGGVRSDYTLLEEPGGNVGSLFGGGDVTASAANQYVFTVGSITEEGDTRYAVVRNGADGTAFRLDGPGSPEQLAELAASLVPTAWDQVVASAPPATTLAPTTAPEPIGSAADADGACRPSLGIDVDD